jgi:integrase
MPRPRLPYLHREKTRHNKLIWVVRVGHGRRFRLREEFGSAAFFQEYRVAVENPRAHRPLKGEGTFEWLWTLYQRSPAWMSLRPATQRDRTRLMRLALERAGNQPLEVFTRKFIVASRDARSATPGVARNFLNAMRSLFAWALDSGHVEMDPTVGIKPPRQKADGGFHTWSADEMARFESRWPLGTRERLAYDIMLWTGLRRGDAARLGPQHVIDGQDSDPDREDPPRSRYADPRAPRALDRGGARRRRDVCSHGRRQADGEGWLRFVVRCGLQAGWRSRPGTWIAQGACGQACRSRRDPVGDRRHTRQRHGRVLCAQGEPWEAGGGSVIKD